MANDFDDFGDDVFKGNADQNAFDSFDDDAFNKTAQFDEFDSPPTWPGAAKSHSNISKRPSHELFDETFDDPPPPVSHRRPTQPPPPPRFTNYDDEVHRGKSQPMFDETFDDDQPPFEDSFDDLDAPPPPHPPDDYDEEEQEDYDDHAPPPPAAPPVPPPKASSSSSTQPKRTELPPPRPRAMPSVPPPSSGPEFDDSFEESEDDDFAPPPPGPPPPGRPSKDFEYDEFDGGDDDQTPPPPGPPPSKQSVDYGEDDDDDSAAPPPGPPPPKQSVDYGEEDDDSSAPPPPGPPPRFSVDYGDDDEDEDAPPPSGPPPPPQDEDDYEPNEIEEEEGAPPPPEPPASDYDLDDDEDEDDDITEYDGDAPPPPPPRKQQQQQQDDDDDVDDDDGYDAPPPPPPAPPPPPMPKDDRSSKSAAQPPPPPVPVRNEPNLRRKQEANEASEAPVRVLPPIPPRNTPGVVRKSVIEAGYSPGSPASGEETAVAAMPAVYVPPPPPPPPPPPSLPPATTQTPVIVLGPPPPSQDDIAPPPEDPSSSEHEDEEYDQQQEARPTIILGGPPSYDVEMEEEDEDESRAKEERMAMIAQILTARGKAQEQAVNVAEEKTEQQPQNNHAEERKVNHQPQQQQEEDEVEEVISPPNYPPPPAHAPPSSSTEEASHLRRASSALLSASEEKQIALRFLRAIDTKTRRLNQNVVTTPREVYEICDHDGNDQVSFVDLAAALKTIDPELSVDQAMRFVNGLSVQAKIRQNRDFFASSQEFVSALYAVAGVERETIEDEQEEQEEENTEEKQDLMLFGEGENSLLSPSRTLEQYAKWIDSLEIWPAIDDVVEAMKSGVLLCKLVEHLIRKRDEAAFKLRGVNSKPRTRAPCIHNVELALGVVWKQRVAARNMPSADRIYNGDPVAVSNLLKEIFISMALPTQNQREMFEWFNGVLKHYPEQQELALHVRNPPHRGLWAAFGGGDALACVLHFFCGPEGSERLPAVDLSSIFANPSRAKEVRVNASQVFSLLPKCGIPVPWDVEDFVRAQDHDMLLVQLANIYVRFKDAACALPLVVPGGAVPSRAKQYVAVGHDGEVGVVGVSFHGPIPLTPPILPPPPEEEQQQPATNGDGEALTTNANGTVTRKRSFTGYHTFSSAPEMEETAILLNHHEGEVSSEVFFLVTPSLSGPPPPVVSEALARSSAVSLERALSRTTPELTRRLSASSSSSASSYQRGGDSDPVAEIRARMRHRLHSISSPSQQPPAMSSSLSSALEERKYMELEDKRRKTFLATNLNNKSGGNQSVSVNKDDLAERVKAALKWLKTPRDVNLHNRNSFDTCRAFVSAVEGSSTRDYALQWFEANDEADAASVLLSEVYDIVSTAGDDGTVYILIHLNKNSAVKSSKGRPVLKMEPVKRQDALRFFANLTVLLEDVRLARPFTGAQKSQSQEEF